LAYPSLVSDGALDSERKRMFMQMRQEVLRLGPYAREFFASQMPELTAMADVVIDIAALARSGEGDRRMAELSAPSIGGTVPT
jgi:hypothetical protein